MQRTLSSSSRRDETTLLCIVSLSVSESLQKPSGYGGGGSDETVSFIISGTVCSVSSPLLTSLLYNKCRPSSDSFAARLMMFCQTRAPCHRGAKERVRTSVSLTSYCGEESANSCCLELLH